MSDYIKATNFASKDALTTGNPLKTVSGTEIDDEFTSIASAVSSKANISSPALTGTPTAPTAAAANNSTQISTTAHTQAAVAASIVPVTASIATKAPLASPSLTGSPTAPTAATASNSTQVATTAFAQAAIVAGVAAVTASNATKAPLASPALTGNPTAPTQSVGNNSTRLATTAFVQAATPTAAVINALVYPVGSIYTAIVATNPASLLGVGTWVSFGAGRVLVGRDGGDTSMQTPEQTGGAKTDSHTLTVAEMPSHVHGYTGVTGTGNPDGSSDSISAGHIYSYPRQTEVDYEGGGQPHTHHIMQPYIVVYFWKRTA